MRPEGLEPLDPALARETHLDALGAAIFAGRLAPGPGLAEIASAARGAPRRPNHRGRSTCSSTAWRPGTPRGYVAGVAPLRRALQAVLDSDDTSADELRRMWLACRIASELWDDEAWDDVATRQVRIGGETGALAVLPIALTYRAGTLVHAGEFAAAEALIEEAGAVTSIDRGRARSCTRAS